MKNESTRKIINVDKCNYSPIWTYKQEDDGVLKLSLFKGSTLLDITGQTIKLGAKRPDNSIIELTNGFKINKNELDIILKNNILAIPGIVECDLEITDAGGKMTTASFYLTINKKITGKDNLDASNDISAINKIVAEVLAIGKELDGNIKVVVEEANKKITAIDTALNKKLNEMQEDYDSLQKIMIDENQAANLQAQINKSNEQLDTKANIKYVNEEIAKAQLEGAGVDTSNFVVQSDLDYLKEELFGREGGEAVDVNLVNTLSFKVGTISASTGIFSEKLPTGYTAYACSDFFESENDISLVVPAGVKYRYFWYNKEDKTYVSGVAENAVSRTLNNQYAYRVVIRLSDDTSTESAKQVCDNIKQYIKLTTTQSTGAIKPLITKEKLSAIGMATKEDIKNTSGQSENNGVGSSCKFQDNIGNYYKINSISTTGNVKGIVQNNQTRWHDTALKIYVEGTAQIAGSNTVSNRGSITINVDNMSIKESLGMWCFIPSKYIVENKTRDGIDRTCTPKLTYKFYNDDNLVTFFAQKPTRFVNWTCGWYLHKFSIKDSGQSAYDNFAGRTINKIVIDIDTLEKHPNFEMYIDSFVVDQRLKPIFSYNLDDGFEDDASLELAHYLYVNNIPVSCRINFATDISKIEYIDIRSMTVEELRSANITGPMIILKGYYEGLFDYCVYSNSAFNKKYNEAVKWLETDSSNTFSISSISKSGDNANNSIVRPIITSGNWQHKLDDTLRLAEIKAGYKSIRGYGKETFYIDNISNVINTMPYAQTYSSLEEITEEWIEKQFQLIKTDIDNAVKRGSIINIFSHKVFPKSKLVFQTTRIMPFEVIKKVLDYVIQLNKKGNIQIMNMDNIYNNAIK